MRLIDADAFKNYIQNIFDDYKDYFKTSIGRRAGEAITHGVQTDIDEQPTAYDVDKVVEQIKDVIVNSYDCERLCKRSFLECNNCQEYGYDEEILKQKIIEIVKKGGIE